MKDSINLSQETTEWLTDFCKLHNLDTFHKGLEKLIDCYKSQNHLIDSQILNNKHSKIQNKSNIHSKKQNDTLNLNQESNK